MLFILVLYQLMMLFSLVCSQVSLVVAKIVKMTPELSLGLFYVACVPGGGMGHVIVSMTQGDRALSMAIHCFATVIAIGKRRGVKYNKLTVNLLRTKNHQKKNGCQAFI